MRLVHRETRSGTKRADFPLAEGQEVSSFSVESGDWRTIGVCVAGPVHLTNGKGCEDQIKYVERNGVLACALADGAGSRKKCKIGARIAVDETCEELVEYFDDVRSRPRAEALIYRIKLRLARRAAELQEETDQLASTLAFVAIRGSDYVAGNLGDGIVGRIEASGSTILIAPEWGEFANQTYFTTDTVAIERLRIVSGSAEADRNTFVLMSDGPVKKLYDFRSKALSPNGVEIGSWLLKSDMDNVLSSLQSYMRETLAPRANDDCSIILVSQVGSRNAAARPAKKAIAGTPASSERGLRRPKPKKKKTPGKKKKALLLRRIQKREPAKKRLVHHSSAVSKKSDAARRNRSGTTWRWMQAVLTAMFHGALNRG